MALENMTTAPVGSIQKFSVEDGPGIRTTVFLKGCPLSCKWCHNPEMISFEPQLIRLTSRCIGCGYCESACPTGAIYKGDAGFEIDWSKCDNCLECTKVCAAQGLKSVATDMTVNEILAEAEKDKGFYGYTGGGITVSGGEMLSRAGFVAVLAEKAAEKGINVCLDTSGYGDGKELLRLASLENVTDILYDMKCIDPEGHKEGTGVDNAIILENLAALCEHDDIREKITMRMPLIKDFNDTEAVINKTADFYEAHGIKKATLLPYHTLGVVKAERIGKQPNIFQPPTDERLEEIKALFESKGVVTDILGRA